MIIGVLSFELYIRQSQSLKDKRHVVKSVKDRLRSKFNVSVAETDFHEDRKRSAIAAVMVGTDTAYVQGALDEIRNLLRGVPGAELGRCEVDFVYGEGDGDGGFDDYDA
ncbi:MAG: DUF503 domain-containing protein [Planctomycetota bacterium]